MTYDEGMEVSSFEINKIAGGVLGALLLAMWLVVISDGIFSHAKLAKPGYDLPGAGETLAAKAGAPAPAVAPLDERLAKADAKRGESSVKACQACHGFEKGGVAKVGPPLFGILDRPKGAFAGFAYSDSLKAKGGVWTLDDLDHFLADPKAYASGTKMTFAGERDPGKRADIIAYLRTLSDPSQLSQTR